MDEKRFVISLEAQKDLIQRELAQAECCSIGNTREALDRSAEVITTAIYSSFELTTQKPRHCRKENHGGIKSAVLLFK